MTTNKPDVKRYDCASEDSYHCHGCFTMKEQPRGDYVEWEDYEALQAECEKLRRDAERYQWLRDGNDEKESEAVHIAVHFYGLEWDEMIDIAMQRAQP